jgi:Rad3-related DNA helicase
VLIKDPLPNLRSRRFQVLSKKWGDELLFAYADDIASRTLAQMVGRGLRHEDDWARVWVLDDAVFSRLARVTEGRARVLRESPPPAHRSIEEVVRSLPPHPPKPVPPEKKKRAPAKRA